MSRGVSIMISWRLKAFSASRPKRSAASDLAPPLDRLARRPYRRGDLLAIARGAKGSDRPVLPAGKAIRRVEAILQVPLLGSDSDRYAVRFRRARFVLTNFEMRRRPVEHLEFDRCTSK